MKLSKICQLINFDRRGTRGQYGSLGYILGGLRAVWSYNRWDYKGTFLNWRDRQHHRKILGGGLRLTSVYIRGDYTRALYRNCALQGTGYIYYMVLDY